MAAPPSARRDRIDPHCPKLVEMTHSHVYGDLWERKRLSKRDRGVATIAAPVALCWKERPEGHIARALGNGLSREEIAEIITHLSIVRRLVRGDDRLPRRVGRVRGRRQAGGLTR